MRKTMWEWLEIEPTYDEKAIKTAYSNMAKKYHPVEFPMEFQELRNSYKAAMKYAKNGSQNFQINKSNFDKKMADSFKKDAKESSENAFFTDILYKDNNEKKINQSTKDRYEIENNREEIYKESIKEDEYNKNESYSYEYKVNQPKDEYDYSGVESELTVFSARQNNMYLFFRRMLYLISKAPRRYGNKKVFEIMLNPWSNKLYSAEFSKEFISMLLDVLEETPYISKGAYDVFEKVVFRSNSINITSSIYYRFVAIRNGIGNEQVIYDSFISDKEIVTLFENYSKLDTNTVKWSSMNFIINKGCTFILTDNILFISGRKLEYTLLPDVTVTVGEKDNQMLLQDFSGKKLGRIRMGEKHYLPVLKKLQDAGCEIKDHNGYNRKTFIAEYKANQKKPESIFFNPVIMARRYVNTKTFAMSLLTTFVAIVIQLISYMLFDRFEYSVWGFVFMIIFCGLIIVETVLVIVDIVYFAYNVVYWTKVLFIPSKIKKELKDNLKNGKVTYLMGGYVYFFDNYFIIEKEFTPVIIPFNRVMKVVKCEDLDNKSHFSVNIQLDDYKITSINLPGKEMLNSIYDYMIKRINSDRSMSEKEFLNQKYSYLFRKRKFFFIGKYLFDKGFKEAYYNDLYMNILGLVTLVLVIRQFVTHKAFFITLSSYMVMAFLVTALVCIVVSLMFLDVFFSTSKDDLIKAQIQMKYPDTFIDGNSKIFVTQDFFVSVNSFVIRVIPLDDIKTMSLNSYIIKKDGKAISIKNVKSGIYSVIDAVKEKNPAVNIIKVYIEDSKTNTRRNK